jgi:hypothetical protein
VKKVKAKEKLSKENLTCEVSFKLPLGKQIVLDQFRGQRGGVASSSCTHALKDEARALFTGNLVFAENRFFQFHKFVVFHSLRSGFSPSSLL